MVEYSDALASRTIDALDDHRIVAHRSADETALARKCRRRALAHHPQIPATVVFAPGIVVMVVHHVGYRAADDLAHPLDHPFAAGIGVAPGELHRRDVAPPDLAVLVDHGGRQRSCRPCRRLPSDSGWRWCARDRGCRNGRRSRQSRPRRASGRHSGCPSRRCRAGSRPSAGTRPCRTRARHRRRRTAHARPARHWLRPTPNEITLRTSWMMAPTCSSTG